MFLRQCNKITERQGVGGCGICHGGYRITTPPLSSSCPRHNMQTLNVGQGGENGTCQHYYQGHHHDIHHGRLGGYELHAVPRSCEDEKDYANIMGCISNFMGLKPELVS